MMMSAAENIDITCCSPKKARRDGEEGGVGIRKCTTADKSECHNGASSGLFPFDKFPFDKFDFQVLCSDPLTKTATLSGKFDDNADEFGVIVAEKVPLTQSSLQDFFAKCEVEKTFQNDIYAQYRLGNDRSGAGELKAMIVYPATQKHLEKYGAQKHRMVLETPELYESITKPYIETHPMSLEWMYNILEGKAEQHRVVCDDADPATGFVLVPDIKWDGQDVGSMYLLAIARRRGILSLRELRMEHVPMLRNILNRGKSEICRRYGIDGDQLRVYLHYQPSVYHLHVHFTHLNYHAPKSSLGDGHLLEDILDNIQNIDPLFYAKKTLCFIVKESTTLWKMYSEHGNSAT